MASFFNKKPKKSRKEVMHENAEKIVAKVEEKVDDVSSVNAVAEQTLKEAQDFITANSDANKIAELSPEKKERATELLRTVAKLLLDSDKIPDEAAGEFVKNLIQNDSKVVGIAVAEDASFIPDSQLQDIIKIPEVGVKDAERIISGIDSTETRSEVQEEIDIAKLKEMYESSGNISNDSEFVSRLSVIQNDNIGNEKINEMIRMVIARRVAVYYSKLNAMTINRYTSVISPVQMLDSNISELAKQEYRKMRPAGDEKEFDTETCKIMIIDELAKELTNQYFSQDPVNRVMIIPESPAIRKFSKEEETELIEQLKIRCENKGEPLKKHQIQDIKNQIRGYIKTEEVESLRILLESISVPNLRRTLASDFEKMLSMIQEFPEEEQEKISSLLVTMTEKTSEKLKYMKEARQSQNKTPSEPNGGGEPR